MNFFNNISIKTRLALIMGFMALMMLAGGAIGLGGIVMANKALETTYKNRLEPTKMIGRIMLLMNDNRAQIMLVLQHNPENPFSKMHDHPVSMHAEIITKNRDEITAIVEEYKSRDLTPEENSLADTYAAARAQFVSEGLKAANDAILAGEHNKANEILLKKLNPLYKTANAEAEALLQKTLETAKAEYNKSIERYELIRNFAIAGTIIGIALAIMAGALLIRSIVRPLHMADGHFKKIA